jgi:hypothetical protein
MQLGKLIILKIYSHSDAVALGNLGLGTITPGSQLTVARDLGILTTDLQAVHKIYCSPVNNRIMRFDCSSGVGSGGWEFYNSNLSTSLLMVQQSGNIGLGATNPVNGKMVISRGSGIPDLELSSNTVADTY